VTFPTSPSDFAKDIEAAFPYVDFVGGCCGTDAEYIKMLREKINQYS
ncbi:MAG: homocysteine S-methyltransferase family protein, partial [Clostridia bacterium]|nr:homocysteine S-methyltransferase family protein [Clostridia bacterium]